MRAVRDGSSVVFISAVVVEGWSFTLALARLSICESGGEARQFAKAQVAHN
jgi:hypothetical protein